MVYNFQNPGFLFFRYLGKNIYSLVIFRKVTFNKRIFLNTDSISESSYNIWVDNELNLPTKELRKTLLFQQLYLISIR